MEASFSLANLWPFLSLTNGANGSQLLTAAIVGTLLLLFGVFIVLAGFKWRQSRLNVNFFIGLVEGLEQSQLPAQRNELKEKSKESVYTGRLWREFDESLVFSSDRQRLSNTLDASHFFNPHTLAQGLTENRMLAAVPGFLTAIGVIGTFLGLQMGLSGIDLNTDDIAVVKQGITGMIKGASIAFLTSVWGVFLSVTFNFIEKLLERNVRSRISTLQNQIDFLYPRINAEQSLVEIADYSQSSAQTMQGLAEKIGERMQQALVEVTDSINSGLKDSLHEIMAPALEKLAMDAHSGSEKALESMLTKFMDGFGSAGESQRAMMESASDDVQKAVGELGGQMTSFLGRLDERAKEVDDKNRLQKEKMEGLFRDLESQSSERQQAMARRFDDMMGNISTSVEAQLEKLQQRDHARMNSFNEQLTQMTSQQQSATDTMTETLTAQLEKTSSQQKAVVDHMSEVVSTQMYQITARQNESTEKMAQAVTMQLEEQRRLDEQRGARAEKELAGIQETQQALCERVAAMLNLQEQAGTKLLAQLDGVSKQFTTLADTNALSAQNMESSANRLQSVSTQLSLLGTKVEEAASALGEMVRQAAATTDSLAKRNLLAVEKLDEVLAQYQAFAEEITSTVDTLENATQHADSGFSAVDRHLQSFQKSMESTVSELEKQISELMGDFANKVQTQTNERLSVWNSQTSEYLGTMSNAVNAIADVVEDIEGKVGGSA